MGNLVIVAIPREDDIVWKVSSEKVPHMTLLFLGDVEGKPVLKIQQFLEHAVNVLELGPFGLDVEYRGTLGDDQADVVFFRKEWWTFKRVAEFRSQLLKNNAIRTAYDSTPQFEGPWQPHLTLGYPATPAKPLDRDYGIHYVQFDRVALWYGDYEGPEFRLQDRISYGEEPALAMSETTDLGRDFLAHYGVKGMHWGQRMAERQASREAATREKRPAKDPTAFDTIGPSKRQKTKIITKGGEDHPASPDAIKVALARQKLKKSGVHTLSNEELKALTERLNLEAQAKRLAPDSKSPTRAIGEQFLKDPEGSIARAQQVHETAKTAHKLFKTYRQ